MTQTIDPSDDGEITQGTTAPFFQCSTNELFRIGQLHGSANDAAAYLVLCGGVNERHDVRGTTHGAKSISTTTEITYRDAEHSIAWLEKHNFIVRPEVAGDAPTPQRRNKTQVQWVITDQNPNVAFSQQLLRGVRAGAKRPLVAFFERTRGNDDISTVEARLDALVLYGFLMRDMDYAAWGGVNPAAWSNRFVRVEESEDLTPPELLLDESDQIMVTICEAPLSNTYRHVVNEALGYIPDEDARLSRFWHALDQLRESQLVYRVLNLWKGDPLGTDRPRHAEPLATLYVNDAWAQRVDPSVQADVNRAAWRHYSEFKEFEFDSDGVMNEALAGRYRYIVKAGTQDRYTVLAQLRTRYWPANKPTVKGRDEEKKRTLAWQKKMQALKPG
ncbi:MULTISPECIES: hypothetical protein [Polaromonas]|uniref:Uncharacterized protein n=1 Tax=Polaromonas aquatica TaxID=332657 RepID=A0ABW1TRC7_9BURK